MLVTLTNLFPLTAESGHYYISGAFRLPKALLFEREFVLVLFYFSGLNRGVLANLPTVTLPLANLLNNYYD